MQQNRIRRCAVVLFLLFAFLSAAVICSVCIGSVGIPVQKIFSVLFYGDTSDPAAYNILWKIRLPRIALAALLGGALSLSGFLIQTFFRNPIAGPFVLGISSGAKLFLTVAAVFLYGAAGSLPPLFTVLVSLIGALLSILLVLGIGVRVKNMSALLVIGIMVSYICSALTDILIQFANDADIASLTHWSHGSFSAATFADVRFSAFIIFPALILTFLFSKPMGAYLYGEGYAHSLGVNIRAFRVLLVLLTGVLSSVVVAFAGPISFVGVAVPHISRRLLKTQKPIWMIPATFLCGALFCVLCDLFARTLFAPTELSVSTVTSVLGAPIVIRLMALGRRKNEI